MDHSIPRSLSYLPKASILSGIKVQGRVLGALILRELHMRYGRSNIGYLWLIAEPLMLATVITLMHMNGSGHHATEIHPAAFMATGYCVFIIFRGIFSRAEGAIEANQPLLHHHVVTITDILLARSAIDAIGCIVAFSILFTLGVTLGITPLPERPLHLFAGIGFMVWWSVSLAFIAVAVTYNKHGLGRMMHVVAYFSIPISGAFVPMSLLPPAVFEYIKWFPMALIFEQVRYGAFRSASPEFMDPGYVAMVCACLTYIGFLMVRRLRRRVAVR